MRAPDSLVSSRPRAMARAAFTAALATAVVPGVAGAAATVPAHLAPTASTAPAAAPSCDEIRGAELGATERWRIVRTGSPFAVSADATVVACQRGVPGPAQVRVLGTSKVIEDSGEDSDAPSGGPYLTLLEFNGSRAVALDRTFTGPGYDDATGSISLVDLERGARTTLLGEYRSAATGDSGGGRFLGLKTVMTPAGALAFAPVVNEPSAAPATGPWTLWDAAGRRPAPVALRDVALSRGSGRRGGDRASSGAGLYFRDAAGKPGRLPLQGAAATDAIPPDPALAWQTLTLERTPKTRGGFSYEFLVAPSIIAPESVFGSAPLLEFSTSSADPRAVVRILDADQQRRLGTLARGSYPELKVIASSPGVAFLIGRFASHPKQRRVRFVSLSRKAVGFFDAPARRAMARPGMVVSEGTHQAIADGDRLRLWVYPRGRVHRVEGVHDLAVSSGATAGLYSTDRTGRVEFRRR